MLEVIHDMDLRTLAGRETLHIRLRYRGRHDSISRAHEMDLRYMLKSRCRVGGIQGTVERRDAVM